MKKVAVTVEFITNVSADTDVDTIHTRLSHDIGDVVHFEALVDGEHKVVGATDYETISAAVLEDVYQDDGVG